MNPWVIEDSVTVAAGADIANIIASNNALRTIMNAPFPFRGGLMAIQTTTGLRVTLDVGRKRVVFPSDLTVAATMEDPYNIVNDEFYGQEGDLIQLGVKNPTAGSLTIRYRFVGIPLVGDDWEPGTMADLSEHPDCMVMQRGAVSVANGSTSLDLLQDLDLQRLPFPTLQKFFMSASAAGMTRELFVEQDRVAPSSYINITNRMPLDPLDLTIDGVQVQQGHQVLLPITNLSGGALNVFWKQKAYELFRR